MSKLPLLLAVSLLMLTAFSESADARHRRHVVHAAPVYATDFWGRCFIRRYGVWWLQMCPNQRLAYARGYVIR